MLSAAVVKLTPMVEVMILAMGMVHEVVDGGCKSVLSLKQIYDDAYVIRNGTFVERVFVYNLRWG